jgi:hypothetical protein
MERARVSPFGCPVSLYRLAIACAISSDQPAKPMMGAARLLSSGIMSAACLALIIFNEPALRKLAVFVLIIGLPLAAHMFLACRRLITMFMQVLFPVGGVTDAA